MPGTYGEDFLVNLAASLAYDVIQRGAGRLRALALGTPEQQALQRAWAAAFTIMLTTAAAEAAETGIAVDVTRLQHTGDVIQEFVKSASVAETLLDMALVGRMPPLKVLAQQFDELGFDTATLPLDFRRTMTTLTAGLSRALVAEATRPDSPLHNRVNIIRNQLIIGMTLLFSFGFILVVFP